MTKIKIMHKPKIKRPTFVFVGGINGVGKTTISRLASSQDNIIGFIKGSVFFMKWLDLKKGDYGGLQSLPDKRVLRELGSMMEYIVRRKRFDRTKKMILIDAHFVNVRKGGAQEWI